LLLLQFRVRSCERGTPRGCGRAEGLVISEVEHTLRVTNVLLFLVSFQDFFFPFIFSLP